MKKVVLWGFVLCIFFGYTNLHNRIAAAKAVLSNPIIIVEPGSSVRMKLSESDVYKDITSTRLISSGTIIDLENSSSFKVLCPDWTMHPVSLEAGVDTFECPEVGPLAEVVTPPSGIWPMPPRKGFPVDKYDEAIAQLENQPITEQDPEIKRLFCYLYLKAEKDSEAETCYRQALELSQSTKDIAGQALARYQLAFILWRRKAQDESIQQIQQGVEVYQQYTDSEENLRKAEEYYHKALKMSRNEGDIGRQILALHQLALIAYVLGESDESARHAGEALELFKEIEYSDSVLELIEQQVRDLLVTLQKNQTG